MLRMALVQTNPVVGALAANADAILDAVGRARADGADLVVFPELAITGYPPEDLLLRRRFLEDARKEVDRIAEQARGIDLVLGAPLATAGGVLNAALLLRDGGVAARYGKQKLPNYSVFDERRYFQPGASACVIEAGGLRLGLTVCEDIWEPEPAAMAAAAGAQIILNLNASPYHRGKAAQREAVVRARVAENGCPVLYLNQVGGQDELVFDGRSFAVGHDGDVQTLLPAWIAGHALVDVEAMPGGQPRLHEVGVALQHPVPHSPLWGGADDGAAAEPAVTDPEALDMYRALMVGIRDYVRKNGFSGVLLGLSGGIDSALTAALAADALGADRVEAVMMPYRYTASMSVEDARQEAAWLGIDYRELAVEPMVEAFRAGLQESFPDQTRNPADVTEQNLQSRCRGVLLMALSNRIGRLLLATGNKSEMAVGYATLYGDMAGGFAPLRDVTKQWVYRLARVRNQIGRVIPERVITRPPSAELAPDQEDAQTLPPYPVLDEILEAFVEHEASVDEIVARGFERETVERVARMVFLAEFKRRQAAPGVRVSARAFGRDRRYPITSGYRAG
ncbi:NAD synthetase / Glutamine amidotransferase chain of NAD synthetase [Thioalkalivibrio nitratireducens DSM 14787]|uniref:Glutamine-dependent NAD(+) synthetase n=2 Tax=Thioalkalivibrio nitratireducens TaxID=186931 RepID=L0DWZ5_THIND|nr:NAD synthetase / Glutamine amidotransferase chain of NAD synthetase [Thioalkalivibrio nitratireducens DSM 14787]